MVVYVFEIMENLHKCLGSLPERKSERSLFHADKYLNTVINLFSICEILLVYYFKGADSTVGSVPDWQ